MSDKLTFPDQYAASLISGDAGAITVAYPAGYDSADFKAGGARLWIDDLQTFVVEGAGLAVTYGAENVSLVYGGEDASERTDIPAGSRLRFEGNLVNYGVQDENFEPQPVLAKLTFGTNIAAATANGALTDSAGTNPTEAQFNELAKELGTKINAIIDALRAAGIQASS